MISTIKEQAFDTDFHHTPAKELIPIRDKVVKDYNVSAEEAEKRIVIKEHNGKRIACFVLDNGKLKKLRRVN